MFRWLYINKPDLILLPCDRVEIALSAPIIYYSKVPIVHYCGGCAYSGTWDDLNRRVISSYASLILCEDERAKKKARKKWGRILALHCNGLIDFLNLVKELHVVCMLLPLLKSFANIVSH